MFGWFDTILGYAGEGSDDLILLRSMAPQPPAPSEGRTAAAVANDPATAGDRKTAGNR